MEEQTQTERPEREERHERPPRRDDRGPRGGGGGDDKGERGPRRGGGRRFHRGKVCWFCVNKSNYVDYKDLDTIRRYLTDRGKILPRRITGTCALHQRMLCEAIKRSRNIALIPFKAK